MKLRFASIALLLILMGWGQVQYASAQQPATVPPAQTPVRVLDSARKDNVRRDTVPAPKIAPAQIKPGAPAQAPTPGKPGAAPSSGQAITAPGGVPGTGPSTSADTSSRLILIIHSDKYDYYNPPGDTLTLEKLVGHDTIYQGRTKFYADSMVINPKLNIVEAFGNVHINDNDSIQIYSLYLKYFATPKKAILRKQVRLTNGKDLLTTDSLDYDLVTHIGTYIKGGKVSAGTTNLTSTDGIYYGENKDVTFMNKVKLVDSAFTLSNDTLHYNTETKIASWNVPTLLEDNGTVIHTKKGYYDQLRHYFYSESRPKIEDSSGTVIADQLAYEKVSGNGEAKGNVVYKDTSQFGVIANHVMFNRVKKNMLATEKPVLVIVQDKGDTLWVAADTFYSGLVRHLKYLRMHLNQMGDTSLLPAGSDSSSHPKLKKDTVNHEGPLESTDSLPPGKDSTLRFMIGFHHVKVFSDSMQAKSDSLFYSDVDSTFEFFTKPALWANSSQITGDTMYLYTKHQKPSRLYVFNNGFIIQKVRKDFYNQIAGRTVNGYFKDGEIDYMRTKGYAHSIYFAQNDSGQFLGFAQDEADAIDMYFQKRTLYRVVFRNGVKGTTIPMHQVQLEQTRLPNFKWLEALRPKSKEDLFK